MPDTVIHKHTLDKQSAIYRLLLLFAVVLFVAASYALSSLLKPFILALFIAYGLSPIVDKLERKGVHSILAILITLAGILVLLGLLFYFLYANVHSLVSSKRLDEYVERFVQLSLMAEDQARAWNLIEPGQSLGQSALEKAIVAGKSYLVRVFAETTNLLSQGFLFVFYLVLLLPGIKNFQIKVFRAFERRRAGQINAINEKILTQVQQYIGQKTLLSLGTAVAVYVLCLAFGIDLALVWAVFPLGW